MDKSNSIERSDKKEALKFFQGLVKEFNPGTDSDHFGFITFGTVVNLVFKFADTKYHNKNTLLKKIHDEPTDGEYGYRHYYTRTDLALQMARDQLFTVAGGDRPDKPNTMIVLTDGKPNPIKKFTAIKDQITKQFQVSRESIKGSATDTTPSVRQGRGRRSW